MVAPARMRCSSSERVVDALKSELGLRSIWYQKGNRTAAHLVLAFHALHLLRTRLKAAGITLSREWIRNRLRSWLRITTTIRRTDGSTIVNRQDVRPHPEVTRITRVAGVEPQLHRWRISMQNNKIVKTVESCLLDRKLFLRKINILWRISNYKVPTWVKKTGPQHHPRTCNRPATVSNVGSR